MQRKIQTPSPGVMLEYFLIYLVHEKHYHVDSRDNKEQDKNAPLSIFSMARLTKLVTTTKDKVYATLDYLTGTDEKLSMLYKYLIDKLDPNYLYFDKKFIANLSAKDIFVSKVSSNPPEEWTATDWIEFMLELRHRGSEAQGAKNIEGQSRCCETFFALADYIQSFIPINIEFQKVYTAKVKTLRQSIKQLETKIFLEGDGKGENQGDNFDVLNEQLDKLILDLAYLGDKKGIILASTRIHTFTNKDLNAYPNINTPRVGLLDHLLSVTKKEAQLLKEYNRQKSVCRKSPVYNGCRPYALQWGTFEFNYTDKGYLLHTEHDCGNFKLIAAAQYEEKLQKAKDEKKRALEKKASPDIIQPKIENMPEESISEILTFEVDEIDEKVLEEGTEETQGESLEERSATQSGNGKQETGNTAEREQPPATPTTLNDSQSGSIADQTQTVDKQPPTKESQTPPVPTKSVKETKKKSGIGGFFNKEKTEPTAPPTKETIHSPTTPRPSGNSTQQQ